MAIELLVRLTDGPAGRERGDIVVVKTLPHKGWGKREGPPHYAVVRVDDATDEKAFLATYHSRHDTLAVSATKDTEDLYQRRSRYKIDLDALETAEKVDFAKATEPTLLTAAKVEPQLAEKSYVVQSLAARKA